MQAEDLGTCLLPVGSHTITIKLKIESANEWSAPMEKPAPFDGRDPPPTVTQLLDRRCPSFWSRTSHGRCHAKQCSKTNLTGRSEWTLTTGRHRRCLLPSIRDRRPLKWGWRVEGTRRGRWKRLHKLYWHKHTSTYYLYKTPPVSC